MDYLMTHLNYDHYCIFGITRWGMIIAYDLLSKGKKIVFCDNDPKKQRKNIIQNCDCISANDIKNDYPCIIAVKDDRNKKSISAQLGMLGITNIILLNDMIMHDYEKTVNDESYLKAIWFMYMGYELNLCYPRTFNEKLQWLKIHDRKLHYTLMVDKYEAKKYVADKIGNDYIIPTYGVWDDFDDIDFDELPDQFVLKCTHDSGSVIVCKNKKAFDVEQAKNKLNNALKNNYYYLYREWPYKGVKPRIIAEKYLEDFGNEINVYKILNFCGEPKIIQVIQNDKTELETIDYFDPQWNLLELKQNYPNSSNHLERPPKLDLMLKMAKELSQDNSFLRVDFYSVCGNVFFSEFTFFSDAGMAQFEPNEWDEKLGELIKLPGV